MIALLVDARRHFNRLLPLLALAALVPACSKATPASPKAQSSSAIPITDGDPKTALARVDGDVITQADLDKSIKGDLIRGQNEYLENRYQMRAQGLDKLIAQRLLEKKAAAEKLTVDALLKRDVLDKIEAPTPEEAHMLYDRAVAAGKELPPYDVVEGDIIQFLKQQKTQGAQQAYEAQLRNAAKVENLMPPLLLPKQEVAAVGPSKGDDHAKVTIVEFSDYQCPYCKQAEPTVKQILDTYKGKVRLVYRDFPLEFHDKAEKASEAALCAADQGKYWEMHETLFNHQDEGLEVAQLKGYAKDVGLDQTKFEACLDGGEKAKLIDETKKAGAEAGVAATPAFFINGRPVSGALPFDQFKQIIDMELEGG